MLYFGIVRCERTPELPSSQQPSSSVEAASYAMESNDSSFSQAIGGTHWIDADAVQLQQRLEPL
jgi:hypothetical protein